MSERYLVRCTSAIGWAFVGIYLAKLPAISGMVATWKQERAARYETESAAANVSTRLARRFSGTIWAVVPVEVAQ